MNDTSRKTFEELLESADIRTNGNRPWDIQVLNDRFYKAILGGGGLAFGETYMAKWWECDDIPELVARIVRHGVGKKVRFTPGNVVLFLQAFLSNMGSRSRAFEVGEQHYDVGNDLFKNMLDRRMTYTCGYWRDAKNLDDAQEAKLDLVCRKLGLKPGQQVLDIGCGWGSFAKFAAEKYGAHVTGVTVSEEQMKLGQELCKGFPVEFILEDYRDIVGDFDHVVSLGMFEHVGYKNYRMFMRIVREHLKDDGLFLLHTNGGNISVRSGEAWMNKYIFPNGMFPSVAQIAKSFEGLFVMEDWHNFSADYEKTLLAWFANFDAHWPDLREKYGETFYRMWKYYLLACAGTFRARSSQLWQVVLSKNGVAGGYKSVR